MATNRPPYIRKFALALLLLFGRHAALPLIIGFAVTNSGYFDLNLVQGGLLLFCQLSAMFIICGVVRWRLGPRCAREGV